MEFDLFPIPQTKRQSNRRQTKKNCSNMTSVMVCIRGRCSYVDWLIGDSLCCRCDKSDFRRFRSKSNRIDYRIIDAAPPLSHYDVHPPTPHRCPFVGVLTCMCVVGFASVCGEPVSCVCFACEWKMWPKRRKEERKRRAANSRWRSTRHMRKYEARTYNNITTQRKEALKKKIKHYLQ